MKHVSLLSCHRTIAAARSLVAVAIVTATYAGAQNFVKNPDFEAPLGSDNWTILYVSPSSEADFWLHDRTTLAHRDSTYGTWDGNYFGLHFRPYHTGLMEAYARQIVTGLQPGASYVISAWMVQFQETFIPKMDVWLETVGGSGIKSSSKVVNYCFQNNGWERFSVTNTATTGRQIEVRLRFKVTSGSSNSGTTPKWLSEDAFYDHVSVMPLVAVALPQPQILSYSFSNQTAALTWTTIMNNSYDVEVSSDLNSWSKLKRGLVATSTNLTYSGAITNTAGLPKFFRIQSFNYVP